MAYVPNYKALANLVNIRMANHTADSMARGRGLTTEYERESIVGEHGDQRKYEAVSRVRSRINEKVAEDVELLREHHPVLLKELRAVVCDDD